MRVEDFEIDPLQFHKTQSKDKKSAGQKRKLLFYQFPPHIVESVLEKYGSKNAGPCWAILLVLYEKWYLDFQHRHKIRLTSADLAQYGVSRGQKRRALTMLVKANVVTIDRTTGKNPWVTCHWLANQKPPN